MLASSSDSPPLFAIGILIICLGLQPKRLLAILHATMNQATNFFGQQDESLRRFRRKLVYDNPKVAHHPIDRFAAGDRISFAQRFDLNAQETLPVLAVRNDIDSFAFRAVGITFQPSKERW